MSGIDESLFLWNDELSWQVAGPDDSRHGEAAGREISATARYVGQYQDDESGLHTTCS